MALGLPHVVESRVGVLPARPRRAADAFVVEAGAGPAELVLGGVVRAEGMPGAPAPWDPLDDEQDYDPRMERERGHGGQ